MRPYLFCFCLFDTIGMLQSHRTEAYYMLENADVSATTLRTRAAWM